MVETSVLVSIVGVALAVVIPPFLRALQTSKVSEASVQLERMVQGAATYYDAFHEIDGMHRTHCLPPSAGPVPANPSADGTTVNMAVYPEAAKTFEAFAFELPDPVRYRYSFASSADGCNLDANSPEVTLQFIAEGDLDDDGVMSRFTRLATAGADGLVVDPLLLIERRVE